MSLENQENTVQKSTPVNDGAAKASSKGQAVQLKDNRLETIENSKLKSIAKDGGNNGQIAQLQNIARRRDTDSNETATSKVQNTVQRASFSGSQTIQLNDDETEPLLAG